jgi:tetratricopeptide (TPR) repeat protein
MSEDTQRGAESIGERLKRLRRERGFSQRELSAPGVSYAYISRIEAGSRRPSVKALRLLARKLQVSPEYLETGSEIRDVDERELRLSEAELELRLAEDPQAATETLRQVLDAAVGAGDAASAARARVGLGLAAAQQARHEEAVRELEAALESTALSPSSRPDVYAALGRSYAAQGQPHKAVELFEECLDRVTEDTLDNTAAYIRFATYLSYALADLGDLRRAESVVKEAVKRAEPLADPYTHIRLYWSLARLYEMEGRDAAALAYVRKAIALLEATEDTVNLAKAHLLCGTIMVSDARAEEAATHLEKADSLLVRHGDVLDVANLRTEQAKCAVLLGRPEEAAAKAREALDLLESDEDEAMQGEAYAALGEALAALGQASEADDAFEDAVRLLAEHGRWRQCANAYRAWARFLRQAGREADALDALEKAADFAVRIQSAAPAAAER